MSLEKTTKSLFRKLKNATMITVAATGLFIGTAKSQDIFTQPVVDFTEDNGYPVEGTNAPFSTLTNLTWDIYVKNNSDTQPTNAPWNEKITTIAMYNLFSSKQPTISSVPSGWSGSFEEMLTNQWKVTFTALNPIAYLNPGAQKKFGVRTYKPAGYQLHIGPRFGQGRFEGVGWKPVESNDFICAVNATSDVFTKAVLDVFEDDGMHDGFYPGKTNYLWNFIVHNNSDTQPTNAPYMTNVDSVILSNLYSSVNPTYNLPEGWKGSNIFLGPMPYSVINCSNKWQIILTCTNNNYISPGNSNIFSITTYVPPNWQPPVTGTVSAAGNFMNPNFGWKQDDDGTIGPVFSIPETSYILPAIYALAMIRKRK